MVFYKLEIIWPNWHVSKQYTKRNITYEAYTNVRGVRTEGPMLYLIWLQLIFDQKPCSLEPSNLETPWPNWHVCKQYTKKLTQISGASERKVLRYILVKNGRHEHVSKNVW